MPHAGVVQFLYRMTQNAAASEQLALEVLGRAARAHAENRAQVYRIAWGLLAGRSLAAPAWFAALDARERAAVLLHQYHGLDCGEIATVLGRPLDNVKEDLMRSYAKLRETLAGAAARH